MDITQATPAHLPETDGKQTRGGRAKGSRSIGWRTRKLAGGRWQGVARIGGKEVARNFDKELEARNWARAQHAAYHAGLRTAASAGTETATLVADYVLTRKAAARSPEHVAEVQRCLEEFAKAFPRHLDRAAPEAVERWLAKTVGHLAPATRNRWLVTVKALTGWALRRRRLSQDPAAAVEPATLDDELAPQFTVEELRKVVAWKPRFPTRGGDGHKRTLADYHLLFCLMTYAGLRCQEAQCLRWEDVDWSGRVLLIRLASGARIKRRRERIVPLQSELSAILEPLRQEAGPIFIGRPWAAGRGFRAFLKKAGIKPEDRTPHSCRHSYAGIMTATGIPGPLLSSYMGHTSVATTMIYTKLSARYVASVNGWPRGEMRLTGPLA